MEAQDGNTMTSILLGLAVLGSSIWAVYEKMANRKLSGATSDAAVAVVAAQEKVFSLVKDRLEVLEQQVLTLRSEAEIERAHRRELELYVFELQDLMRANSLVPPIFKRAKGVEL